jgi:hypothetical protein
MPILDDIDRNAKTAEAARHCESRMISTDNHCSDRSVAR